jgi:hypothetical protein
VQFSCTVSLESCNPISRSCLPDDLFRSHMPLLRLLRLNGLPHGSVGDVSNLVDIGLRTNPDVRSSGTALFKFLQRSPLVEHLDIRGYRINEESSTPKPRIELPRLATLRLKDHTSSRFILSRLDTPAIRYLSVRNPTRSYRGKSIHPSLPDDPSQLTITRRIRTLEFTTRPCLTSPFVMRCHKNYCLIIQEHKRIIECGNTSPSRHL